MSATDFEYAIKKDVRNNPIIREVDEARHRFALVHGVRDHPLEAPHESHRIERRLVRDAVDPGVVALVELDLVIAEVALEPDQGGGPAGDPADLLSSLGGLR